MESIFYDYKHIKNKIVRPAKYIGQLYAKVAFKGVDVRFLSCVCVGVSIF